MMTLNLSFVVAKTSEIIFVIFEQLVYKVWGSNTVDPYLAMDNISSDIIFGLTAVLVYKLRQEICHTVLG